MQGSSQGTIPRSGRGTHSIAQPVIKAAVSSGGGQVDRGWSGSCLGLFRHVGAQKMFCQVATRALRELPCFLRLEGKHLVRETALGRKCRS